MRIIDIAYNLCDRESWFTRLLCFILGHNNEDYPASMIADAPQDWKDKGYIINQCKRCGAFRRQKGTGEE